MQVCSSCDVRVIAKANGTCPSCGATIAAPLPSRASAAPSRPVAPTTSPKRDHPFPTTEDDAETAAPILPAIVAVAAAFYVVWVILINVFFRRTSAC